ncbi:MAG: hypothetical protein LBU11_03220, partial [Zoogloeaceae bacterium]|nr:hypothetical protein [Zoogloeaceae bacterium]
MVIRAEEEARVFADPSVRAVMVGVAGEAAILDARLGNRCGGGAMAAIQKSALRFFEDFGYRGIGLSCRLENGVCHMRG